jgi:hypothetical protein
MLLFTSMRPGQLCPGILCEWFGSIEFLEASMRPRQLCPGIQPLRWALPDKALGGLLRDAIKSDLGVPRYCSLNAIDIFTSSFFSKNLNSSER